MKESSKIKPGRPAAQKSVDPVPEVTVPRPSTAEKMRLKSQLEEECFSVPMEAEIPICNLLIPQDGFSSPIKDEPQDDYDYQPVPSAEVLELQQKNRKLEDKFKRACLAARTAELRAEAAESRLDAKYGIKESFEAEKKRADDLASENESQQHILEITKIMLDSERKQAEHRRNRDKARLAEISSELDEERRLTTCAFVKSTDLELENNALKTEKAELIVRMANTIEAQRQQANDNQASDRERIEELASKLAQYEGRAHLQQPQLMPHVRPVPIMDPEEDEIVVIQKVLLLHDIGHPTNILQLCRPDTDESMPIGAARDQLLAVSNAAGLKTMFKVARQCRAGFPQVKESLLHCDACTMSLRPDEVVPHFLLSIPHQKKVSALGAAVSRAALKYWQVRLKWEGGLPLFTFSFN